MFCDYGCQIIKKPQGFSSKVQKLMHMTIFTFLKKTSRILTKVFYVMFCDYGCQIIKKPQGFSSKVQTLMHMTIFSFLKKRQGFSLKVQQVEI